MGDNLYIKHPLLPIQHTSIWSIHLAITLAGLEMSHGVANGSDGPGIKLNLAQQARLAADLRNAISECSERGLYNAAKW
jgi:hypothetical protein